MIIYPHELSPLTLICHQSISAGDSVPVSLTLGGSVLLSTTLIATSGVGGTVSVTLSGAGEAVRDRLAEIETPAAPCTVTVGQQEHDFGTVFQLLRTSGEPPAEQDLPTRFLCRYNGRGSKLTYAGVEERPAYFAPTAEGAVRPTVAIGFANGSISEWVLPATSGEAATTRAANICEGESGTATCTHTLLRDGISTCPADIYTCTDGTLRYLDLTPLLRYLRWHNRRASAFGEEESGATGATGIDASSAARTMPVDKAVWITLTIAHRTTAYVLLEEAPADPPLTLRYTNPHGLPDTLTTSVPPVYKAEEDAEWALRAHSDSALRLSPYNATATRTITLATPALRTQAEMRQAVDLIQASPKTLTLLLPPADAAAPYPARAIDLAPQKATIEICGRAASDPRRLEVTARAADAFEDLATIAAPDQGDSRFTQEYQTQFD